MLLCMKSTKFAKACGVTNVRVTFELEHFKARYDELLLTSAFWSVQMRCALGSGPTIILSLFLGTVVAIVLLEKKLFC